MASGHFRPLSYYGQDIKFVTNYCSWGTRRFNARPGHIEKQEVKA